MGGSTRGKKEIKELTEAFPQHSILIADAINRIVDLFVLFRNLHYHNPKQHGSNSMKTVLPALTGQIYKDLGISEGGMASREYERITYGEVTPDEKEEVRRRLLEYCCLDTKGMVEIMKRISKE